MEIQKHGPRRKGGAMSSPFIYWISCLLLLQWITTSSSLKQHKRTTQNFAGHKPRSYWTKIKVLRGLHFFQRLWGRSCFIVLCSFLRLPPLLGWWSLSTFKTMVVVVSLILYPSDTDSPLCLFHLEGLLWLLWAHLDNPGYSPHLEILNLNHFCKIILPCEIIHL